MTGTSKALARFGVTGLSAAVIFTGLAPLTEMSAFAAQATTVTLSPDSDTAAVGQCNPFTATVSPVGSEVTVNIQEAVPTNADAGAVDIGFCNPSGTSTEGNGTGATTVGPGTNNTNTTPASPTASQCTNAFGNGTGAGADDTKPKLVTCNRIFDDTNNDGSIVFGVTTTTAGSMSVNAFGDSQIANGAQDANESGETSTKTWVANDKNATGDKIDCSPETDTEPASGSDNFTCVVTDANGNPLAGVDNIKWQVASGPDSGQTGVCGTTADGTGGSTPGEATCTQTNGGTPGHDVIDVWLEQNGTTGRQAAEPTDQITADYLLAAPSTSTVTVSCTPNSFAGPDWDPEDCQGSLKTGGTFTLTALVQNGSPAQPVSGVIVQWNYHEDGYDPDGGTDESLSDDSCTTNAQGMCSVTLKNTTPVDFGAGTGDGEDFHFQACVPRQGTFDACDSGHAYVEEPQDYEARNILVEPTDADQVSGGAQELTATVTDRFGNPVENVNVDWKETGPGDFRNQNSCDTDANGQCSVEVESLATETGDETVTATLDTPLASDKQECEAPADRTYAYGDPSTNTPPGFQTETGDAPAGNCTDTSTVTWTGTAPPPSKTKISASINCFSPRKHVLKCKVIESPARAGLLVRFKKRTANGVRAIGTDFTNSNGVAKITRRHLKSHKLWRVFAHVYATSTTTGANTNTDRTRIK